MILFCPFCGSKIIWRAFDGGQCEVNGQYCPYCKLAFRILSDKYFQEKLVWFSDTPLEVGK